MYRVKIRIDARDFWLNNKFELAEKEEEAHFFSNYNQAKIVGDTYTPARVEIIETSINVFSRLSAELAGGTFTMFPKSLIWERFAFYPCGEKVNVVIIDEYGNDVLGLQDMSYSEVMMLIFKYVEKGKIDNVFGLTKF